MRILFDEKVAQVYDTWYETEQGKLADSLERELMWRIGSFNPKEKILDIGCGTGHLLQFFTARGMEGTGIDVSFPMLRVAKNKLDPRIGFCLAKAEALPFKARTFDCIVFMTTLEFVENPLEALKEAVRVSRDKILLGVLNKYSLIGLTRRIKGIFRPSIYSQARFYSIWELKKMLTYAPERLHIRWGSVLTFPLSCQQHFDKIEKILSFRKNHLGAFLVLGIWKRKLVQ